MSSPPLPPSSLGFASKTPPVESFSNLSSEATRPPPWRRVLEGGKEHGTFLAVGLALLCSLIGFVVTVGTVLVLHAVKKQGTSMQIP